MGARGDALVEAWVLVGVLGPGRRALRVPLETWPFVIGRQPGLGLTLPSDSVSARHAEILHEGSTLRLRDLGSTNGTFVNRARVRDTFLSEGDIIHFADFEFRLAREEWRQPYRTTARIADLELPQELDAEAPELLDLIREGAVVAVFQPVVELSMGSAIGHEALGRGRHAELSKQPADLFRIAAGIGSELSLSWLFRRRTMELIAAAGRLRHVFLNSHPAEIHHAGLVASLHQARELVPDVRLTLEIHENAIVDLPRMAELKRQLEALDVGLAYDDFGAGEARLLVLGEVPPDYLKFDMSLVRGLGQASQRRRRLLASLVEAGRELGAHVVAEGVETEDEAAACRELGFSHAQGYHFGWPRTLEELGAEG